MDGLVRNRGRRFRVGGFVVVRVWSRDRVVSRGRGRGYSK